MTYRVNGTEFTLQPTSGQWMPREELGRNGFGHPVYPAVREYEIRWVLKSPAEVNQIKGFYDALSNTGTAIVDLPQYGAATYAFISYTGCILSEPQLGPYYSENYRDVVLVVSSIRV